MLTDIEIYYMTKRECETKYYEFQNSNPDNEMLSNRHKTVLHIQYL